MAKKLSILDKTFQLALLLHRRTAEFNRKYKFTIGDRIDVVAEEAQEMILRANHQPTRNGPHKSSTISSCVLTPCR